ncbi:hypothetical protein EV401DRAFT_1318263 [Pisolithus croceorrhizus]|nr:hypothetical protein EV401DRAFT_1318263 [Pisolithus croceorrhizus]
MTIASEISGKGHSSLVETPRTRCECASQRQHDSRYAYTAVETRRAMGNKVGGNKLFWYDRDVGSMSETHPTCEASNEYNTLNIKSQSRRKLFVGEKGTNAAETPPQSNERTRLLQAPASDLLVEDDEGTWAPRVSACVSSYCETRTMDRRESHGDEREDILRPRAFVQPHSSELSVRDEREDQLLQGRGPCTRLGLLPRREACGESGRIRSMWGR